MVSCYSNASLKVEWFNSWVMCCYSVAAQLYQENRREYKKQVAAIVEQSWQSYSTEESNPTSGSPSEANGLSSEQPLAL